jgi:hypothetical protein
MNIDVMWAKRKMSVTELADKVGITMANISVLNLNDGGLYHLLEDVQNCGIAGLTLVLTNLLLLTQIVSAVSLSTDGRRRLLHTIKPDPIVISRLI